jgi:hypothetical protein
MYSQGLASGDARGKWPQGGRGWLVACACLALLTAYAWRVWAVQRAVPSARVFHDTQFYFSAARNEFFSQGIWAGERSPVPLLVFKWCQLDPEKIRSFLRVSSALSWLALACAAFVSARSVALRCCAPLLVLWLAVSRDVIEWNEVILSESLSFSCAALCLACALSFLRKPREWALPLIATAALFGLCRDSNAYLVLCFGLLFAVIAVQRGLRRRAWVLPGLVGLGLVVIFLASNVSSNLGRRWEYPLTNVIVWRVLPKPSSLQQMAALGMPTNPALRAGRPRRSYGSDARLSGFREWLSSNGKRSYIHYLLAKPGYLLGAPAAEAPALLGESLDQYSPKDIQAAGYWATDGPWLRSGWWLRLAALPLLCGFVLLRERACLSPFALVGIALALLVYPHALVVWHGDAMEVPRHGLQLAFQVELALLFSLLAAAEAALGWVTSRSSKAQASGTALER